MSPKIVEADQRSRFAGKALASQLYTEYRDMSILPSRTAPSKRRSTLSNHDELIRKIRERATADAAEAVRRIQAARLEPHATLHDAMM